MPSDIIIRLRNGSFIDLAGNLNDETVATIVYYRPTVVMPSSERRQRLLSRKIVLPPPEEPAVNTGAAAAMGAAASAAAAAAAVASTAGENFYQNGHSKYPLDCIRSPHSWPGKVQSKEACLCTSMLEDCQEVK